MPGDAAGSEADMVVPNGDEADGTSPKNRSEPTPYVKNIDSPSLRFNHR